VMEFDRKPTSYRITAMRRASPVFQQYSNYPYTRART
jgi:hypothetical protein